MKLDHARSALGKSRGQSRMTLPCAVRSRSSMISRDRTVFFSPRISGMVLFFLLFRVVVQHKHTILCCVFVHHHFFFYPRFFTLPTFCWELRFTVMLKYSRLPYSFQIFLFILLGHTFIFESPELVLSEIQKQLKDDVSKRWSSAVE